MLIVRHVKPLLPGMILTVLIALCAKLAEAGEHVWLGGNWIESLVLAIIFGVAVRSIWGLKHEFVAGVNFCGKTVLNIAIVLLGGSITVQAISAAGASMIVAIFAVVCASLFCSFHIGRALGLSRELAMLVACGNSICGNSAIAATAPVIEARSEDIAASIAFTAVLGVGFVLFLPLLQPLLGLSFAQYGALSGLTVYAVPQVLAATAPIGPLAVQVGTLVKLTRVLTLGPVVFTLALMGGRSGPTRMPLSKMVPWFIVGFIFMMLIRSAGFLPEFALVPIHTASSFLTILAMAALGLSVDLRSVMHVGGRVMVAAAASLATLSVIALCVVMFVQP